MLSAKNIKNIFLGESLKIKKKKICVFIIASIILLQSKVISSYVEKINLKVTAQIAKPIFVVNHDEKIVGNYSDIKNVPEYNFEIKNYDKTNMISEIPFNVKFKILSQEKIEFEVIDTSTNEVILNNNQNEKEITIEKNNIFSNKYKVKIKSNLTTIKDNLKIIIDAKYFKYNLEVFDINLDKRDLEYNLYVSESDRKYTNKDVIFQIKCNKEIKSIPGFNMSSDETCLTKTYHENARENILIEDYYNNKKSIQIIINNIDKVLPEIIGVEDGKIYDVGLKLVYKDNIGIKSIMVENTTQNQSYTTTFDSENKIIDNQVLVLNNDSINPYYLNNSGNYKIIVTDFADNQTIKHITIK